MKPFGYRLLSKKAQASYNAHDRLDKKYTNYINNVKYDKNKEIKAVYHGAVADKMIRYQRKLTNEEKKSISEEASIFIRSLVKSKRKK